MTDNLATALAAFQAEMPTVAKSHRAEVPTKSGGKYTYTYADLADVSDAAMPLLSKNGLSFTACPRLVGERGYELLGRLLHVSGDSLEGALPIAGNTPQEMGSSITYMRRYLLGCMTGIVTDDDDDGQLAQKGATKKAAAKRAAAAPAEQPQRTDAVATRRHMFALFGDLGIAEEDQLPGINRILGTSYESRGELTEADAKKVIDVLKAKKVAKVAELQGGAA